MAIKRGKFTRAVLITGAGSGLGLEIAKVFAEHKHNLVLVGRDRNELQKVEKELHQKHKIKINLTVQDLLEPDAAQTIYDKTKKERLQIDILVNNAGVGTSGKFVETDLEEELKEIQLNVVSLTTLTKLFVKDMAQKKSGKILNVASTAAFFPGPLMSVYYATKAYVLSFSLGLAEELRKSGVQVSVLCPGPTKTKFAQTAGMDKSRLFGAGMMNPKKVAQIAYDGLKKKESIIIPGSGNQALVFLSRFVPRSFQAKLVKFTHQVG